MQQVYQRGKLPLLPHAELDPDHVRRSVHIAIALLGGNRPFIEGSGYSASTLLQVLNFPERASARVRSDLLRYARQVAQEQKQTFFDLASVEPVDIPEAVYPYRLTRWRLPMPVGFVHNRENPFDPSTFRDDLRHHLWNTLYLSVRPGNSDHIHLYGRPLLKSRAFVSQLKEPVAQGYLENLLNGPDGHINTNSVIANPTILDYFAKRMNNLQYNIWGNALQQNLPDVNADVQP